MDQITGFFNRCRDACTSCKYNACIYEFAGTAGVFLLAATQGGSAVGLFVAFSIIYCLHKNLGFTAHFNPAITVAEVLHGRCCPFVGFFNIIYQVVGAKFGVWLAKVLFASDYPAVGGDGAFSAVMCSEFLATAVLVWMWLLIHSKDSGESWSREFVGMGVGLAYYMSNMLIVGGSANPAGYLARKHGADWNFSYSANDWAFTLGPIFASFIVSLMFNWYHN